MVSQAKIQNNINNVEAFLQFFVVFNNSTFQQLVFLNSTNI